MTRRRSPAPLAAGSVDVVPATPDRWADVVTVLGGGAGDRGCWCQAPRGLVPGGRTAEPGARQDALRHHSRRSGAPGLEAYPIDPGGGRVDVGFGYVGLTPMFEQAGFVRVLETAARSDRRPRILMRLMFDPAPTDPR